MHEHGSEERQKITEGIGKEAARNESPLPNKSVTATQLYKEKQDVQSDEGIRDQRKSSARGIVITYWEHKIYLLLLAINICSIGPRVTPCQNQKNRGRAAHDLPPGCWSR
jgi:hypothetical protein